MTVLFGALVLFAPPGIAAPRLKVEAPPQKITVGQTATLKVRVEWPQNEGPYEVHSLEPKLENLTLVNQNQTQETGATLTQTLTYEFRSLKAGTAVIYPFEIGYRKTDAAPWNPILVPEQTIKVVSGFPFKGILISLGILAGLSAILIAGHKAWQALQHREATKDDAPPDPKQRVYAKAEESIATFASPDPKEKITHWSNQLRTVVVTYYDIPSKTATNAEVLSFLRSKGLLAGEWNEISRLFEQLTEMQFSRADIPSYELERTQKTLLQYVRGKIIIGNPNF
jgi:hypothetical protein